MVQISVKEKQTHTQFVSVLTMKEEEEAKVPTRLDSKVQEEVMEKTVDTKAATQNKLWFPEKTDAESHNSDVEHDEAVTRKQSYFIGMRGLLSCGEKVVSRITTAIVAYGLCGDSVDIDQVEENISMPWLFNFKQRLCVQARLDSLFTNLLLFSLGQCGKESPFFSVWHCWKNKRLQQVPHSIHSWWDCFFTSEMRPDKCSSAFEHGTQCHYVFCSNLSRRV